MDISVLQLSFAAAAVVALLYAWRSWVYGRPSASRRRSHYLSDENASRAYNAAQRLFDRRDVALLQATAPSLVRRLRAERHEALRLYLRQIRLEFAALSRFVREAAAANGAPEMAAAAARQAFAFYPSFALLSVLSYLGWMGPVTVNPAPLLRRLQPLRELRSAAR